MGAAVPRAVLTDETVPGSLSPGRPGVTDDHRVFYFLIVYGASCSMGRCADAQDLAPCIPHGKDLHSQRTPRVELCRGGTLPLTEVLTGPHCSRGLELTGLTRCLAATGGEKRGGGAGSTHRGRPASPPLSSPRRVELGG